MDKVKYHIFKDKKLVSVSLLENIKFNQLMEWHNILFTDPDFSPDMDGIVDQRVHVIDVTHDDIEALIKMNKENKFVTGRWCHLIDAPKSTAIAMLYQSGSEELHDVHIFNSVEGVSQFLGYDVSDYLLSSN